MGLVYDLIDGVMIDGLVVLVTYLENVTYNGSYDFADVLFSVV